MRRAAPGPASPHRQSARAGEEAMWSGGRRGKTGLLRGLWPARWGRGRPLRPMAVALGGQGAWCGRVRKGDSEDTPAGVGVTPLQADGGREQTKGERGQRVRGERDRARRCCVGRRPRVGTLTHGGHVRLQKACSVSAKWEGSEVPTRPPEPGGRPTPPRPALSPSPSLSLCLGDFLPLPACLPGLPASTRCDFEAGVWVHSTCTPTPLSPRPLSALPVPGVPGPGVSLRHRHLCLPGPPLPLQTDSQTLPGLPPATTCREVAVNCRDPGGRKAWGWGVGVPEKVVGRFD